MHKIHLAIENLSLSIDKRNILQEINLQLEMGEIGCLLGPSGCGKTSLLRIIAGLEERGRGQVTLGGKKLLSDNIFVKPQHRKIGMVFQDYSLFPHLTVKENILLGLDHLKPVERIQKCDDVLTIVKLSHKRDNYPHQLSGGEQQRVALARALAQEPTLLLLDEPFSNLDAQLRTSLADEVRQILVKLKMTAILVTHDQTEAFSFADKITVINNGLIEQTAKARDLYNTPSNVFVARFIGEGAIVDGDDLTKAMKNTQNLSGPVLIRPEQISLDPQCTTPAVIIKKNFSGSHFNYELKLTNSVYLPYHSPVEHELGAELRVKIDWERIISLNNQT